DDGRVFMDSRFVQTAEFVQEEQTDRFLFRSTFGTRKPQDNLLELYLKNPANVNAVAWGDRLLAMYEAVRGL
ncbi:lignostilbene-alpha,beta-dioxygenase-like enzyme, partial [Leptolyngbya sp. PCC 7375]